jgi:hypothetical protein
MPQAPMFAPPAPPPTHGEHSWTVNAPDVVSQNAGSSKTLSWPVPQRLSPPALPNETQCSIVNELAPGQ